MKMSIHLYRRQIFRTDGNFNFCDNRRVHGQRGHYGVQFQLFQRHLEEQFVPFRVELFGNELRLFNRIRRRRLWHTFHSDASKRVSENRSLEAESCCGCDLRIPFCFGGNHSEYSALSSKFNN